MSILERVDQVLGNSENQKSTRASRKMGEKNSLVNLLVK